MRADVATWANRNEVPPELAERLKKTSMITAGRRLSPMKPQTTIGCVVHYTAGWDAPSAVRVMLQRNVSVHATIERDGTIYLGIPVNFRAVHAAGSFGGYHLNHSFYGIELVGMGKVHRTHLSEQDLQSARLVLPSDVHCTEVGPLSDSPTYQRYVNRNTGQVSYLETRQPVQVFNNSLDERVMFTMYTEEQYKSLDLLLSFFRLVSGPHRSWTTIGHDVADGNKSDPGPTFRWSKISDTNLLWTPQRAIHFHEWATLVQEYLSRVGLYPGDRDGRWGPMTTDAARRVGLRESDAGRGVAAYRDLLDAYQQRRYHAVPMMERT